MPATPYYYRLHIRDEADALDVLVLSSKPGDPNTLLAYAPEGEGQTIDPIMGTLEVGSYTWQAIDRYDGDDSYTITALIADEDARNQLLSHKCIGRYSTDGTTWSALHTGYLNDLKLSDAKTYTFIVGDTDRRERDAVLFKTITDQFDKVSNIIGGPVEAETPVAWGGTPKRAWGPIIDYGPARMVVIANPSGLVDSTNRVTLSLVGGNLPPRYLGQQGVWNGKIPNPAEYIDQRTYQYFEPDVDGDYKTNGSQQSQPWGSFPQLEVKLKAVSGGGITKSFPIAQATKKASSAILGYPPLAPDHPVGDERALVANSNDWLIVAWDVDTMGAQPSVSTAYDVWVRPITISENNPLHIRGHPVDLHRLANTQEGIPDDAASAATVKAALGPLVYELRITEEWEYSKFTEMLKSSAGYAVRYNSDSEQEFLVTRAAQPDEVDTVTAAVIIGDDFGEPKEVIFAVSEGSAIKGVDYTLKSFRLWNEKDDANSDRPIDGVIAVDITIHGTRRDESVKGSRIITFDVPGMIMLEGTADVLSQPMKLRDWIIECGEVLIDRAGWGWPEGELEVLATVAGQVGDYIDIEHPAQVNAKVDQDPVTQRGGTRKVQIVSRTELPGTSKLKVKDAGNLAQDAPEAGDTGTGGAPFLPVPELTLAPSADAPFTIATVTLVNVDEFTDINADVEFEYLVQTATPAPTDEGADFGPLASSAGDDTIDAPAILAGQTIWVRGRAVAGGTRGEWSDWISITLGPDEDGEGDTLPALSLALSLDADGVLSAVASGVPEIIKVYFLAGAAGGAPPTFDDVVASATFDTTAPFTAASLATMDEGETRTVGAVGEDALGNRTQLALASITRAVDTGAGTGTPGNQPLTWHATPAVIVRSIGAALFEPEAAIPARRYLNTLKTGAWRWQLANWMAASGVEFHLIYSLDGGLSWNEAGPMLSLAAVRFPVAGEYGALVAEAKGTNILFSWGLKGGDGTSVAKVGNIYSDATSSATPPVSPEPPDDTDLPQGGPLGTIIYDINSTLEVDDWADGVSVTRASDRAGYLPGDVDAQPNGGIGQSPPTMRHTGFSPNLPCIEFDGVNDGLEIPSQLTGASFTTYFVLDAITAPAGDYGTIENGNVFPNGKGVLFEADGDVGVYVNTTVIVPTYTAVPDTWTKANKHIYAWVYDKPAGVTRLFVDDDEVLTFSDGNLTIGSAATALRMGAYTGVFPLAFKLGRRTTWNAAHHGTIGDPVRAALRAYWGTP